MFPFQRSKECHCRKAIAVMRVGETKAERNERVFGTSRPVAFVTGSQAPRVGRAIADLFESHDFQVVRHGHRSTDTQDGQHLVVHGGVEDEANVQAWLEQVLSSYDRIDVVVNSAAIWDQKSLEDLQAEDFKRQFEVNAMGSALICRHFGLAMTQQSYGGAVINIGDWAVRRPYAGFAAYFPSKSAVVGITESMSVELGTRNPNVRVNAVLPGPVLYADSVPEDQRQEIAASCLLQRNGTAEDVADAALYFATAPFVTGISLPVDGGRTIYSGPDTDTLAHPGA